VVGEKEIEGFKLPKKTEPMALKNSRTGGLIVKVCSNGLCLLLWSLVNIMFFKLSSLLNFDSNNE